MINFMHKSFGGKKLNFVLVIRMKKYCILTLFICFICIVPSCLAGVIIDVPATPSPVRGSTSRILTHVYDSTSGLPIKPDGGRITILDVKNDLKIVDKGSMVCDVGSCYYDWEISYFSFLAGTYEVSVEVSYQGNTYLRSLILEMSGKGIFDDFLGPFIGFVPFLIFIFLYQKMIIWQIQFKLERNVTFLERLSKRAEYFVLKKITKKPNPKIKKDIKKFMEFFVISPVNLDPYGIMKKLEHLIDQEKWRFKYFVEQIAKGQDSEKQANIMMGLSGAMSLYQLMKLVRHFVELIKKTKSQYLALMLQMQLPLIERIAKALLSGTEALSNGWPIGDSIGACVAANLIENSKVVKADEETVVSRKKYKNRNLIIIKARGPGGRTGNPGRVLNKIAKKEKIVKIVTIDAALKLEGEKTGSIAEGVGAAIGGIGVERTHIEEIAVKKNIPLDSIIIKMSQEEAITPMKKEIIGSLPVVMQVLDETIDRTKGEGKIIIVGVGNTSGVGNNKKDFENAKKIIEKNIRKMKRKSKKKKKSLFKLPF